VRRIFSVKTDLKGCIQCFYGFIIFFFLVITCSQIIVCPCVIRVDCYCFLCICYCFINFIQFVICPCQVVIGRNTIPVNSECSGAVAYADIIKSFLNIKQAETGFYITVIRRKSPCF
jgi:hypothetical protein